MQLWWVALLVKEALASVGGGAGTLINLFVGFCWIIGRCNGNDITVFRKKALKEVKSGDPYSCGICHRLQERSLLMLTGLILAPDILKWMNTPGSNFEQFNYLCQNLLLWNDFEP